MRAWQRWWPLSGVLFAVLFVLTVVLVGDAGGSTAEEAAQELPDAADRLATAFLVGAVSTAFLLTFFAGVRDLVVGAAPTRTVLAALSLAPVAGAAALVMGSLATLFGLGEAAADTGVTAEVVAFASSAQYGFLVAGMMLLGLAVASASLGLRGTGALPDWLCWAGVVVAVLQLVAFMFFPMLLLVLWILVAAVVLTVRRPQEVPSVVTAEHARPTTAGLDPL
ncbi:MAG: hypothetical protein ACLGIG_06300 [Actinomycetes bacterium]